MGDSAIDRYFNTTEILTSIVNALSSAVVITDADQNILFWSDNCLNKFGWTAEEAKGKKLEDFLTCTLPDKNDCSCTNIEASNSQNNALACYRFNCKNGKELQVYLKVKDTQIKDQPASLIAIFDDAHNDLERALFDNSINELNRILDSVSDIVFTADAATETITQISRSCERIYGYTTAEFLADNKLWLKCMHPDDVSLVQETIKRFKESGEATTYQYRIIDKDGDTKWLETTLSSSSKDGTPTMVDGITRDISARKKAEEALQKSEEIFREFFEEAPELIMVVDADTGLFVDMNKKAEKAFKLTREEFLKKSPIDISPEFQPDGNRSDKRVLELIEMARQGKTPAFEWIHCDSDGREFPCEIRLKLLPIQGQNLVRASGLDITDKKFAEKIIRESEERFRLVSETPNLGITWGSPGGRMIEVNEAFAKMLGYTREEMVGMSFTEFVHPDELKKYGAELDRLLNGRQDVFRCDARYLTKNKEVIWASISISSIKDDQGKVRYNIAVVQDVTAKVLAEKQLRNLNESLEVKVRERTARLEEANKDLEAFNYTVSHDLRTPLRGLDMFRTLLERELGDNMTDTVKSYLDNIRSCTQEMDEMIHHLLDFAKAGKEIGEQELKKEWIDMTHLVQEKAKRLTELETDKNIDWQIDELPDAMADVTLIKQVWTNLMSNAIKYSSKNEIIKIHISGFEQDGQVHFCIQDNGVGFTPRQAEKLFKPFSRIHSPKDFEGNGAGLAIVYKIINFHNGTISASAEPGKGATFCFSIPKVEEDETN